jgi:uncharacterized protein
VIRNQGDKNMRILLIGATGMIGSRVASEARRRGHDVTGVTRSGTDGTQIMDATDADAVAKAVVGHDAVVLAAKVALDGPDQKAALLAIGWAVKSGMQKAGVRRLIVVGGAGSLVLSPGVTFIDQFANVPNIPKTMFDQAHAQTALLEAMRKVGEGIDWTYISPGGMIEPGERTGQFRVGGDEVLVDKIGKSHISAEDYAVGLVDELEKAAHIGRRINFAY